MRQVEIAAGSARASSSRPVHIAIEPERAAGSDVRPAAGNNSLCHRGDPGYKLAENGEAVMLGVCLAYVGTSLMLGVFLAALGHRHRVWSRADLAASDVRRRGGGRRRVTIAF